MRVLLRVSREHLRVGLMRTPGCRSYCGAERMSLYDVPAGDLKVPDVSMVMCSCREASRCRRTRSQDDFSRALDHATRSVAPEELERFEQWTREFGEEGV